MNKGVKMTLAEKKIIDLLKGSGFAYELHEHEPVYTCEQAARVRGITPDKGIKCLLLKSNTTFILALTRGDRKIDLKRLAALESIKRFELASEQEIEKIAECPKGCVHPFCGVKTYFDRILLENETVEFNPGCHDKSVKMRTADLVKLIKDPVIEKISID